MSKMASMIMTKTKVFWSKNTDSHEEIIREFGLSHLDRLPDIGLVRVEIAPPDHDYSLPMKQWQYQLDQDQAPDWYNAQQAEESCRKALIEWFAHKIIADERKVTSGNFVALSGATVRVSGDATVEAWGNATVRASGDATVWASGNATVWAWDDVTVRVSGDATVEAWGNATVEASGDATVEASGDATVIITKWHSKNIAVQFLAGDAIIIDRRSDKIKVLSACDVEIERWVS